MSTIKPIFVPSNTSNAVKAACTMRTGFFIAIFTVPTAPHINGAVSFVKGLKTFTRCLGWIHGKSGTVFCCSSSHKISNKAMRNTQANGLPTGESNPHYAELRQLLHGYLNDIGGIESLKDDVFQVMESLVASMETLGLDSTALLHYFYVCRCTVEFIADLEYILEPSKIEQPCNN